MTVRQITGSVRLLRILHGLGHTASVATVYKHDTALAIAIMFQNGNTTLGDHVTVSKSCRTVQAPETYQS